MGRVNRHVTIQPSDDEWKDITAPFHGAKGFLDPLGEEVRKALIACAPDWLTRKDYRQKNPGDVESDTLRKIAAACDARIEFIEKLPELPSTEASLAAARTARERVVKLLEEMGVNLDDESNDQQLAAVG